MGTELTIGLHSRFTLYLSKGAWKLNNCFFEAGKEKLYNYNLILLKLINQGILLQMPMLSRATFDDDNPTPGYIYQEINSILSRLCHISNVNSVVLKNICTVPPLTTLETRRKDFQNL